MLSRRRSGSIIAGALFASVLSMSVGASVVGVPAAHAVTGLGAGGEFHPLTPTRIYDTRFGIGTVIAPIATNSAGVPTDISILNQGGVPASATDVLAVAVSITVVNPTKDGYLQVYPTGAAAGVSSVLNYAAGQNVPNLTVLTVGAGGKITVSLVTPTAGTADVLVDVFGWFSTSTYATSGARLIPVGPARIYDSRVASFNPTGLPLGQGASVKLGIRGANSQNPNITAVVPNSPNVVGVVINVTGINDQPGSVGTFVSVLPAPPVQPVTTSNLNLTPGQIKANLVVVPVSADGSIWLYNNGGQTHLAVDVVGYMLANQDPNTRLGRVIPLTSPFRAFDTRLPAFGNVPLGPGQSETWSFSKFVASVTLGGQAVGNQIALLGNLTGTALTRVFPATPVSTYVTLYPSDVTTPLSSNINVTEGANVPNMSIVKLGADGGIKAFNNAGSIHYLFDVSAVVLQD